MLSDMDQPTEHLSEAGPSRSLQHSQLRSERQQHSCEAEAAWCSGVWEKIKAYDTHLPKASEYIQDAIEAFESVLDEVSPFEPPSGVLTLADLDKNKLYDLMLEAVDDHLRVKSVKEGMFMDEDDDESLPPEEDFCFAKRLNTPFPVFGLGDVEVCYKDPKRVYVVPPSHVKVNGQRYYFKPCLFYDTAAAEITKHTKIYKAHMSIEDMRCVRLFGLVEDKDGYLHAILYHVIDEYMALSSAVKSKALLKWFQEDLLQKWADQMRKTVNKLHGIVVIWGDVKAQNVLIDQARDAWVIDLEGGTARVWAEKENQGTLEGDAQGMERLMGFIFNEESPLRVEEEAPWDDGTEVDGA